jgi:hypothetical protein
MGILIWYMTHSQSSSTNIMTTNNVMPNTMQDSVSNDMEFDEEAMCRFMTSSV